MRDADRKRWLEEARLHVRGARGRAAGVWPGDPRESFVRAAACVVRALLGSA